MNYELKVTITNNKAGKFHYQVIDENGTIISERKSNREYVACTIKGSFYFGRLDLIGKGDHGRYMRDCIQRIGTTIEKFKKTFPADIYPIYHNQYDEYISDAKSRLEGYQQIAYKK
jgi:hypothetical protein